MTDNKKNIEKRFTELYERAYERYYIAFTEFLNLEEQSILAQSRLPCMTFGGYEGAERIVAAFGETVQTDDFPIVCVCLKPASQKFADRLSHRDFLGALMNLGIRRELLGDIFIYDGCGYLFCLEKIGAYIADNLTRVKHTSIKAQLTDSLPALAAPDVQSQELIVSSCRADVLLAAVYKLSRKDASLLFQQGKVFVNSIQTANCSYTAKENDIFSVRGFGRFQFISTVRTTKKDRIVAELKIYR